MVIHKIFKFILQVFLNIGLERKYGSQVYFLLYFEMVLDTVFSKY